MGFVFGLLIGAIAALMYAPKPGDMTREELRARADELKKRADDLQRIAQKMADDVTVKGREVIDDAKKQWERTQGGGAGSSGASGSGSKTA
ncbi:MAG TPA: YtxH domain-containing protein [Candidatus Limnocylindria bacterium]|nr:YtxH domain-containing protein [Candidatus Limnocylindria bacterium]